VDVIEIDAATNRGIDEIRELRDAARYRPARDKYKIYILDEAHQITDAAFNALLKTLEEPPEHIVFMMATTQPEDIPQTVRSRCQHFSFHAVKLVDILGQLRAIADKEELDADDAALSLLAEAGDGSMRDALSIMDQAIASAPVEDGHPRLDVAQIRELMGTVSNAAFESIFEAVDGSRSAEVMTLASGLLDAGNSPAQLARQCVRYLRNCLMAKVAGISANGEDANGIGNELLQVSADEQRRAARTAALFTEEELTRFLQVMLRTFDELGSRQEQRFHFELGLLKLVHLRRLLPVEELLSQLPAPSGEGSGRTSGTGSSGGRVPPSGGGSSASTARPVAPASASSASASKSFSPFEQSNRQYVRPTESAVRVPAPVTAASVAAPAPVKLQIVEPVKTIAAVAEVVVQETPVAQPIATARSADDLQKAAVEALESAGRQTTAADALADATWTIEGDELRVQMLVSKTMLPMVVNADAEKIVRAALREHGGGTLRLTLLPGTAEMAEAKKPRAAKAGSAADLAAKHPVVQQAQKLFNAEIRNVIDLRDSE
jgi:DNA polymerase-3 subunit gamma/tau